MVRKKGTGLRRSRKTKKEDKELKCSSVSDISSEDEVLLRPHNLLNCCSFKIHIYHDKVSDTLPSDACYTPIEPLSDVRLLHRI